MKASRCNFVACVIHKYPAFTTSVSEIPSNDVEFSVLRPHPYMRQERPVQTFRGRVPPESVLLSSSSITFFGMLPFLIFTDH